ncbi:MAG: WYL domain-containing protein [bacterium]|nr:WYL domain-containing protein [Acidimicrobiia bacterium]MCY4649491.1 WYL domain-containing protein [bacterium]
MRKRERLLNLLCLLWSSKHRFTREEIFRRMVPYRNYANPETARRTFERDKKTLRQVGFDIQTSQLDEGPATYTLAQPNNALGEMQLSDSERMALAVSVAMVKLGGALSVDRTLVKLGAGLPGGMAAMNVDMGDLETEKVHDLLGAVQSRSHIFFDYKGSRRKQVEPLRIVNRSGQWYLQAREEQVVKTFRIDRLSGLYVSPREDMYDLALSSEGPNILTAEPWEFGEEEAIETTVRFDAEAAWYVRPRLPSSVGIKEEDDGSLTVVTAVTNRAAFFFWMLDFVADGEIVGPDSMRRAMVEWVMQSLGGEQK